MYGLFKNQYDYYEWSDVELVSAAEQSLVEYCDENKLLLLSGESQEKARDSETVHYQIKEIEEI